VLTTQSPPRTELVSRAAELVPLLRTHAQWVDDNRDLHEEVVEALAEAGIFRLRTPARYGGFEADAHTTVDVLAQIGRGCGSTAWNTSVWTISNWLAGMFPDHVQDEVFSTPNVRCCGVLSPTAEAKPTKGGYTVNGRWAFISGARHSQWQVIVAMGPAPDGSMWPVMALVPMSDLQLVDDWYTAGLRGTGSITTVAQDVFVPADKLLPMPMVLAGQHASETNRQSPVFHTPMVPTGCTTFTGTALGLAKGAMESFLERLPGRKITYSDYADQSAAPLTHLQVAEAAQTIDEAKFHAYRLADKVDHKDAERSEWTVPDRVFARAELGRVFGLVKQAVDVLNTASGGSSVYRDVPIQRIERDIQTLNLHALMHPDTNAELYGRILCGQQPNTNYL
jgi:alkylation response protein AidB-like acyl-CoA dehydrogenase